MEIVQPEAEASVVLILYALDYLNVPSSSAASYLAEFRSAIELTPRASPQPMADTLLNPPATARFEVGDTLRVFGSPEQIDAFEASLRVLK